MISKMKKPTCFTVVAGVKNVIPLMPIPYDRQTRKYSVYLHLTSIINLQSVKKKPTSKIQKFKFDTNIEIRHTLNLNKAMLVHLDL